MKVRGAITLALLAILVVAVTPARAASTRAEYVAQAEAVCAAPTPQLLKISKHEDQVIKQARAGNLRPSQYAVRMGKLLGKLATIEGQILTQLATIPPAPGDEAIITAWLQGVRDGDALLVHAVRAGKHGNLGQMLARLKQSISVTTQAEQPVAGFGFEACNF
jgi:hypothetical protein